MKDSVHLSPLARCELGQISTFLIYVPARPPPSFAAQVHLAFIPQFRKSHAKLISQLCDQNPHGFLPHIVGLQRCELTAVAINFV